MKYIAGIMLWDARKCSSRRLLFYRRLIGWTLSIWAWTVGTMAISLFEIIFLTTAASDSLSFYNRITVWIAVISSVVGLVLTPLFVFFMPLIEEIDRQLRLRKNLPDGAEKVQKRVTKAFARMIIFLALPVSVAWTFRNPSWLTFLVMIIFLIIALRTNAAKVSNKRHVFEPRT